ncbi:MAG TPA: hypothetical protein VK163_02795 [Opitutaceae bacterium]|nr:hypothetical protein [Opitutaceae bacterium]
MNVPLQIRRWREALDRFRPVWPGRRAAVTSDRFGDIAVALDCSRATLLSFGSESDKEFTALAQEVGRFNTGLDQLRRQASQLSAVVEDRDEERALSAAYALYKGSVDLVHASLGVAVSEQEQMQVVEQQLLHACVARSAFERNDMMLRLLTMNIRMEAVRLDAEQQSVFFNVAAAIGEIAQKVLESSATAFGRIETIVQEAAAERDGLRRLEETLHRRAHRSVETIFHELERLRKALAPCADRNRAVAERLERTGPITLSMLMALQHQDIVRQKLEHIAVGFGDIAAHLPAAGAGPGPDGAFVHQAASVQHAQLRAARDEIEQAGGEVTGGLRQLVEHGEALLSDYTSLEQAVSTAFTDCRLADLYREQITELAGIAAQGQGTNEKVARSVARIDEVVRVFSQEIARQEFDVKIVSLNAQIAAARMSSAGALNRLSEECSRVSDEIGRVTAALAAELDTVLGSLQQISAQADSFLAIVAREKLALEQGAVTVSEQLRRLSEQIQRDAARTGEDFAKLFQETTSLLRGLRFPELIATSFDPAEALCRELQTATAPSLGHALAAPAAAKLAAHRERYTMEEERRAHAKALGASAATAAAARPEIELFAAPAAETAPTFAAETATAVADSPQAATEAVAPTAPETADAEKPVTPKPDLGPGIELF